MTFDFLNTLSDDQLKRLFALQAGTLNHEAFMAFAKEFTKRNILPNAK